MVASSLCERQAKVRTVGKTKLWGESTGICSWKRGSDNVSMIQWNLLGLSLRTFHWI